MDEAIDEYESAFHDEGDRIVALEFLFHKFSEKRLEHKHTFCNDLVIDTINNHQI